jgi:hypothetical protein
MSHGWTRKYRVEFERSFYDFLGEARVNSKDYGEIVLGEHLYRAQKTFFTNVFDGLEQGLHIFDLLKSRQLGASTGTRALSVFWQGLHDGMAGACVFDTDMNKQNARREIETMIRSLPDSLDFPRIKSNNRNTITLDNDSSITFLAAGVKKSKSSGTLGRSLGLSMYHASELCSYDNEEGWEAFENSKSEIHRNRLYIRESTARGFNSWHEMWTSDRKDPAHVLCCFLGWWSKDSQIIARDDPDFERYGLQPPTDKEIERINQVQQMYGWQITEEQLAWIRRKTDPTSEDHGDAPADYTPNVIRLQEQPWTEEDAFQMTGAVFFHPEKLTEQMNANVSKNYKTFMFAPGVEFTDMRIYKAPNARSIELKVWDEPQDDCVYVVSADPAFGSHEDNDRSAIQVLRGYADGCDQVAEYAWPLVSTRSFGWIILAIAAYYAKPMGSEVFLLVELNGPGMAVWDEIESTRRHINAGYQPREMEDKGLPNIFFNVRNYLYSRPDSLSAGKALMWKTSMSGGPSGKVRVMERLRDFTDNGMLKIRSRETLEEMRSVTREGDSIAAQGSNKDDRVMSLALGIRCWEERVRRTMSVAQRTRDREWARLRLTPEDKYKMFTSYQFQKFLGEKNMLRKREQRAIQASRRRFGR